MASTSTSTSTFVNATSTTNSATASQARTAVAGRSGGASGPLWASVCCALRASSSFCATPAGDPGAPYAPVRVPALALQPQPAPYKADIEVKQIQTLTQEPEALERVPENSSAGTEPPPSAETDAQPLASSASQVSRVDQPPSDSACQLDEDSFKEEEALSEKKRRVDQPPWRVDQSPSDSACQPDEDSESFKEEEDLSEKKRRVDQPPWRVDQPRQPDEDWESFKEEEDLSEKKPADNSSDMESDLDFVPVENKEHQWGKLMEKWENEKKRKMTTELARESDCREVHAKDECESLSDENQDNREGNGDEDLLTHLKRTRDVLQRYRLGKGSSGKHQGLQDYQDGKTEFYKVDVDTLRFSQRGCSEHFQCGRPVSLLVDQLLDGRVGLSAPFLLLTVFEERDEDTGDIVLKSADNRRLYALKEYAKKSGKRVMANVTLFSKNTLEEVKRIWRKNDRTPGTSVYMRRGFNGKGKGGPSNNNKRRR